MLCKLFKFGVLLFLMMFLSSDPVQADFNDMKNKEGNIWSADLSLGYRWVDTDSNPNRAAEYVYLDDSATMDLSYILHSGKQHFSLIGQVDNKNDYHFNGNFDYKALIRLNARTERFFHNLDHYPYQDNPEARPPVDNEISYQDQNPLDRYGRKITIDEVKVRGKLPTYPAHINLGYWRLQKKGKEQQRYADESCTSCHMQSRSRKVDSVTEEITAGVDAHLGLIDVAFLQTFREYKEKSGFLVDSFGELAGGSFVLRNSGDYIHDVNPRSKLSESTVKINLSQSGGFVSSASYTWGSRKNRSNLGVVAPVRAKTNYEKLAADATYTPGEKWTINFRYRMLNLNNDAPAAQSSDGVVSPFGGQIPVRDSLDIDRNNYTAYVSYRPTHRLTLKGELEYEDTKRTPTGLSQHNSFAGIAKSSWDLPDKEKETRVRASFYSRFLEKSALRINGWYEYRDMDDPAYSTTLSTSNEVFLSANYKPATNWGLSGNLDIVRGTNDDHQSIQFDGATPVAYGLDRDEDRDNLTMGLWMVANEIFSADLNYGWLYTKVDQDVLFGSSTDFTIYDNKADYKQKVHTLSVGFNLRPLEQLNCRLEGYHIRSHSEFSPGFASTLFDYSDGARVATAEGLEELSEVELRQNGARARISLQLTEQLTAGIEYSYDDYEDRNSDVFDGDVQALAVSLAGTF